MREDALLEPAKLRSRLEAKLLREHATRLLEGLQRIRLAAAAVKRQHQLSPQSLPEGALHHCRAKRRDDLTMLAELECSLELLLERVNAQRLEPACLGAEPRGRCEALERRPAPERHRRRDGAHRGVRVALPQRGARLPEQRLKAERIDAHALECVAVG